MPDFGWTPPFFHAMQHENNSDSIGMKGNDMGGEQRKRPRGRPAKSDEEAKRYSVGLTTTLEMKKKIRDAAERSGRSQTQEIENRLEQSFADEERGGGWHTDTFMRLLAAAISRAEEKFGGKWTEDLAAHAAVARFVDLLIAARKPRLEALLEPETIDTLRRESALIDEAEHGATPTLESLMPGTEAHTKAEAVAALKASVNALINPLVERTVEGRLAGDELAALLI